MDETGCSLSKSAGSTKWGGMADAVIQRDLDRLEEWDKRNLMKFKKMKGILSLVTNNPRHQDKLGLTSGKYLCRERRGVLVDPKLNTNKQWTLAAEIISFLGCIRQNVTNRKRSFPSA